MTGGEESPRGGWGKKKQENRGGERKNKGKKGGMGPSYSVEKWHKEQKWGTDHPGIGVNPQKPKKRGGSGSLQKREESCSKMQQIPPPL